MATVNYFAYGSNINANRIIKTCPSARKLGTGFLVDRKLIFAGNKGNAIASIVPGKKSRVPVVCWQINAAETGKLTNAVTLPYLYIKNQTTAEIGGKILDGIVYVPSSNLKLCVPGQEYLSILRQGYGQHGLDEKFIDNALLEASVG
ncbi:MAG: gamma-glutamylcyclotransferase [Firmicutes bacterium]|nr:gamma-glutamylcyclotransferase [Bacillota bacterium]